MYVYRFIITFPTQNKTGHTQKTVNGTERRTHRRRCASINRLSHVTSSCLRILGDPKIPESRRSVHLSPPHLRAYVFYTFRARDECKMQMQTFLKRTRGKRVWKACLKRIKNFKRLNLHLFSESFSSPARWFLICQLKFTWLPSIYTFKGCLQARRAVISNCAKSDVRFNELHLP